MRRISDYRRRFMELYGEGLSDNKIGQTLGFNRQTVGDYRRGLGLPSHFKFSRPGLTDEEKGRIRELHSEGLPINRIAEKISRSHRTVFDFCWDEGLDTSMSRGRSYRRRLKGKRLVAYLKEQGPTPQSTLSEELGIGMEHFPQLSRELFDQVERLRFKVGRGGRSGGRKHGGTTVYGDLLEMGPVFAIRGDPRIIDFVAEGVSFKVENTVDARTLVQHLKKQIGYERARAVVEKLGYQYQTPSHKAKRRGRPRPTGFTPDSRKFTDEQLLRLYKEEDLNDTEAAELLGVSKVTVSYRRRKLGLPPKGRGRFRALDFLPQMEDLDSP